MSLNNFDDSSKWIFLGSWEIVKRQIITTGLYLTPFSHISVKVIPTPNVTWRKAGNLYQLISYPEESQIGNHFVPFRDAQVLPMSDIGQCKLRFTPVPWHLKSLISIWGFYGVFENGVVLASELEANPFDAKPFIVY